MENTTITVKSTDGKGKFNLRTITIGDACGSRAYDIMYHGLTDKGRKVYVMAFDDGVIGIKDAKDHPSDASCKGWANQYFAL